MTGVNELPQWAVLAIAILAGNVLYLVVGRWVIDWHYDRKHAAALAHFDAVIDLVQASGGEHADRELAVLLRPEVREQFEHRWMRTHWRRRAS